MWRRLVARSVRVGEVIGSNPVTPTTSISRLSRALRRRLFWELIEGLAPGFLQGTKLAPDGEFSWVFVLAEAGPQQTRLILRTRTRYKPAYFRLLSRFPFTIGELLFPFPILRGIKLRVESSGRYPADAPQAGGA